MSIGGGGREELQQISEELEELQNHIEQLRGEIEGLREDQRDIDDAIEGLNAIETGSTVQVPVGGGARVRATIDDVDEVVVDIGGGYAAEQNREDAIELLEEKKENIDDSIDDLTEEISELEAESQELEGQAMRQRQELQQQMQQQMQGQLGGDGE